MNEPILKIRDLCKTFDKGKKTEVVAAYHINLTVGKGECISVVGESGCGKSTLAKLITVVERPDSGEIYFEGVNLPALKGKELREKRHCIQMVFQQPMSAISPRMSIDDFMKVPLVNFKIVPPDRLDAEVDRLLEMVHIPVSYRAKYPHEVSGGELQRIMIARAIAGKPELLICDEATSALDVAVQQDVIELIRRLQIETGVACIFITHDLSLVHKVSQRVVVMYRGRIVEEMPAEKIAARSLHPYTKLLLSSVFSVHCDQTYEPDVMMEDTAAERKTESCPFYGRCPQGREACGKTAASLYPVPGEESHRVACSFALQK